MTHQTTILPLLGTLFIASLICIPFFVAAQERDTGGGTEAEMETRSTQEANYNNTRSNRSTISVSGETNVCDGVTCADGSCAATADECTAVSVEAEGSVEMRGNSQSDAGTEPARTRTEARDPDNDGDGLDDGTERAQNHNSSRSNRTDAVASPDFSDSDDDGDGIETRASGGIDKATPVLFETLRRPENNQSATATARAAAFMKIDDIKGEVVADTESGERRLNQVSVAAEDLRSWTEEDRAAFTRLRASVASNTPEHASLRVTERVLENDRIEELTVTPAEATIRYRTNMRLFGFIPVERTVEGRAQADGTVTIDYPWYRFLSRTPNDNEIKTELQSSIEILMTLSADPN